MNSSLEVKHNIPLALLTTLKIGGPAKLFVRAETEQQVVEAFDFARGNDLPVFILGGGSNVLIADAGIDGLVLQVAMKRISKSDAFTREKKDLTAECKTLTVSAGEDWDAFVEFCVKQNLAGIECLSGIPGFVGGTPVQNVGAYGQEVSETIVSVRCYDREDRKIVELGNAECGFSYRTSIFNTTHRDRFVVLSVQYSLTIDGEPKIAYKDLREFFSGQKPTLAETRDAVLQIRRTKSMVIDDGDPNSRSAGSFFKNPIVSNETFSKISSEFGDVPSFKFDETHMKIPAAWLIEQSGFQKGFRLGNAGISTKHTLAIINCGGATAVDVLKLKDVIQTTVEDKFGIMLQPEPIFVGF